MISSMFRSAAPLVVAFLALSTFALAPPATAGTLHPTVEARLGELSPGEALSVIAFLDDGSHIQELSRDLTARDATREKRHYEIVTALQAEAAATQPAFLSRLDALRATGAVRNYTPYWIVNAVVIEAEESAIREIGNREDLEMVTLNFQAELIEPVTRGNAEEPADEMMRANLVTPGVRAINADEVWYQLGITGAGRLIASCDTGVDGNHPALASRWRGTHAPASECWLDLIGAGASFPSDGNGHGTHVTGTMAGLGVATGDTVGVAWGAEWIATNPIDQGVSGAFDNDILQAFQWFADPDGNPGTVDDVPDVVQNSWGVYEGLGYPDCFTLWWTVIDNCEAAGVVTTWSAGNEGPGGTTHRSPADRATTDYNTFSVGAVDATNFGWPYPIASFSSRGPSGCDDLSIKPEVSAPGVSVYSSVPGGGYSGSYSGTSMAGPHVAGIVALMREADPNLEVDEIKQIIFETARDVGQAGNDNVFGAGIVDAFEAVALVAQGLGTAAGTVTHSGTGNPIAGAEVRVVGAGRTFVTGPDGTYGGFVPQGTYDLECTHAAFDTTSVSSVAYVSSMETVQDFAMSPDLTDGTAPVIASVSQPCALDDTVGPYPIDAVITDDRGYVDAKVYWRAGGGSYSSIQMTPGTADEFSADLPGQSLGTTLEFYVEAEDAAGNVDRDPAGAPGTVRTLVITASNVVFQDDVENDMGWTIGLPSDDATTGHFERADPVGTVSGDQVQPEDDHSPLGTICFVTDGSGGAAGTADVDDGCTTILSPLFDLSGSADARISYWRWWYDGGSVPNDDVFEIDISDDGGSSWSPLEHVTSTEGAWTQVSINVCGLVSLTDQMQLRFRACDVPNNSLVEALVDDVRFETFAAGAVDVPPNTTIVPARTELHLAAPNPATGKTSIRYTLARQSDVTLKVYDVTGREVRTLVKAVQSPGSYSFDWSGEGRDGRPVASGVYFFRLEAEGKAFSRRVTVLR